MMKTSLLSWIKQGNITIPTVLISEYKNLHLNEDEMMLILHIMTFLEKGKDFPTPEELSSRMTISTSDCTQLLRKLIQQGFVEIIEGFSNEGIRYEKYSLNPLMERLVDKFLINEKQSETESKEQEETDLYTCFEKEFGRPLSPFECESLGMWLDDDHHDPVIIKAALREAVMSGKLNFRYIDRILFEWKKNGIKTIEQAKSQGRKYRQKQMKKRNNDEEASQSTDIPFYNWLEQ